jgi:hypothetical protein
MRQAGYPASGQLMEWNITKAFHSLKHIAALQNLKLHF